VISVDATIFDITDDQPLSEAQVSVFADNQLQEKTRSWQGNVTVNTLPGKDYQLLVEREGYNDRIIDLGLVTGSDEINIALIPQNKQRIGLSDIDLNNVNVLVMAAPNGEDQLYLTTGDALFRYEIANDRQYLISDNGIILLEENFNSVPSVENISQVLSESNIMVSEIFNVNSIYYDFDKAEIREDAAIELDKLAAIMSSNKNIKMSLLAHTDSRGSTSYNENLSERRGMAAVKYLTDKGIDIGRLTVDAKGESQLTNSCSGATKCSEEAHQLNRRTEFILSV
jgi:outer membrane protein OmpA-like peptidoglycan-associated protein